MGLHDVVVVVVVAVDVGDGRRKIFSFCYSL